MSWLNEIDAKYGVDVPVPSAYSLDYGTLTCIRRMARVIRELVKVARATEEASNDWGKVVQIHKHLNNLSPDAKEVIND